MGRASNPSWGRKQQQTSLDVQSAPVPKHRELWAFRPKDLIYTFQVVRHRFTTWSSPHWALSTPTKLQHPETQACGSCIAWSLAQKPFPALGMIAIYQTAEISVSPAHFYSLGAPYLFSSNSFQKNFRSSKRYQTISQKHQYAPIMKTF